MQNKTITPILRHLFIYVANCERCGLNKTIVLFELNVVIHYTYFLMPTF